MFDCGKNPDRGRFVLLHHTFADSRAGMDHWDLMLESPNGLLTWRMLVLPMPAPLPSSVRLDAERLANHRLGYLEYEGPISGGRGAVRRVAGGTFVAQGTSELRDRGGGPRGIAPESAGGAPAAAGPGAMAGIWQVTLEGPELSARLAIPGSAVGAKVVIDAQWWRWHRTPAPGGWERG